MRRYLALVAALTLGLLLIVMVVSAVGPAQEPGGDNQVSVWSSSAPIPEGMKVQSPPDRPVAVDAADEGIEQSYDAYVRIAGSALKPRESNVEWTGVGGGGAIYASSGSSYAVFNVPVYLPQGATVTTLRMYYSDTNASVNCSAWFTVYDLYGMIVEEWQVTSAGSAGNGFNDTSEFSHTIDYALYSYVVNWRPYELGSDMQVCGFRIFYETPPGESYVPLARTGYE